MMNLISLLFQNYLYFLTETSYNYVKGSSIKPINVSIYQDHLLPTEFNGSQFFLVS